MKPSLVAALALVVVTAAPRPAAANPGITGYSGKPYYGASKTCKTDCHTGGGPVPSLVINAPEALEAGKTGQVSITVNGSLSRTSMNAALSDGVKATAGNNTTIPFPTETPGEVGAVVPPPSGGSATYTFSFVAPNKNGPVTLWIAGMAASGDGNGGDGVATATRTITVSGATASTPEDAGPSGGGSTSSGGSTANDGGRRADGGGTSSSSGDETSGDDDESTTGASGRRLSSQESDGCATSRTAPADASAVACAALTALALTFARRRRR